MDILIILKDFLSQTTGSIILASLIMIILVIILLAMIDAPKDLVLLVPLPMLISFGSLGLGMYSVIAYIIAGIFFADIILSLVRRA
jgi:hypothetical protein